MRQAARMDAGGLAARDRRALARTNRGHVELALGVWRALLGHAELQRDTVGVFDPDAIALDASGRVNQRNAALCEAITETRQIVLKDAEGEILELLARPLADNPPTMGMAIGVELQRIACLTHLKAELGVEEARLLQIRYRKGEMVQRVDAQDIRAP